MGPIHKPGLNEIGTNKGYKGTKYNADNDGEFLQENVSILASDKKFQQRKDMVGPIHKQGAQEIGTVHGFKGTKYNADNDGEFLQENVHSLAKDTKFQQRKQQVGPIHKASLNEIGTNKGYKGTKYNADDDPGFLQENVSILSTDKKFQQRKDMVGPIHKQGAQEIGTVHGFKGTQYDGDDGGDFLSERVNADVTDAEFQKRMSLYI